MLRRKVDGTLDLLVLKTLSWGSAHGYDIARWIQHVTGDVLRIEEGSLYPALHRLEKRGWLSAAWEESETGRPAKFYKLSAAGRKQLAEEEKSWQRMSAAIALILRTAE